jgi:hypothetical protein
MSFWSGCGIHHDGGRSFLLLLWCSYEALWKAFGGQKDGIWWLTFLYNYVCGFWSSSSSMVLVRRIGRAGGLLHNGRASGCSKRELWRLCVHGRVVEIKFHSAPSLSVLWTVRNR